MSSFSALSVSSNALEHADFNPFQRVGKNWMLITAELAGSFCGEASGEEGKRSWNTMTASWGTMGTLWNKKVAVCFVRPVRYTYQFMEKADYFTLSFLSPEHRKALNICGSVSGRDRDKVKDAGLHPVRMSPCGISFEEADLVFVCKKMYAQDIDPGCFIDPSIADNYPQHDYHRAYTGEIIAAYRK